MAAAEGNCTVGGAVVSGLHPEREVAVRRTEGEASDRIGRVIERGGLARALGQERRDNHI